MNELLQQKLFEDFPEIYRKGEFPEYPFFFGFECDDGWFDLLYEMSKSIKNTMIESDEIIVNQVKEKFGGLRFYYFFRSKKEITFVDKIIYFNLPQWVNRITKFKLSRFIRFEDGCGYEEQ